MKIALRIILVLFALVATYFFIYWLPFSLIPGAHEITALPQIASLLIAIIAAVFVWKKTRATSNSLASYILLGGLIVGAIGFIIGFFGPIIFAPSSNLGPLLGIFITGPLGFLLGLFGGAVSWKLKKKTPNIYEQKQKQ